MLGKLAEKQTAEKRHVRTRVEDQHDGAGELATFHIFSEENLKGNVMQKWSSEVYIAFASVMAFKCL